MSKLTDQQERQLRRAFAEAIAGIKDNARISQLQAAIARNDLDSVLTILGMDRAVFAGLEGGLASSYQVGGEYAASQIGRVPVPDVGAVVFRFNARAPAAERWLSERSSRLVTEILDDQREVIRTMMARGVASGAGPRDTALSLVGRINPSTGRRLGGAVGLTSQQQGWVNSAADELASLDPAYFNRALRDQRFDGMLRKAISDGVPLKQADIDRAIVQMQNRALRYRGEVIARTESINALRAGQFQAIEQAAELGEVDPKDVTKTWRSAADGRERPEHGAAEGQEVPSDQPFNVGGDQLMFPGDTSLGASAGNTIQCRCRAEYNIDFLGRAVRLEGIG